MIKNKKLIILIVIFVCTSVVLGILYYNETKKYSYTLNLPLDDSVYSINMEQDDKIVMIEEQEKIKDIMFIISKVNGITTSKSVQDSPVNAENVIKINIEYSESSILTLFIYKKKNKYFIEQPYNGIYRISFDEYYSIEKYI